MEGQAVIAAMSVPQAEETLAQVLFTLLFVHATIPCDSMMWLAADGIPEEQAPDHGPSAGSGSG